MHISAALPTAAARVARVAATASRDLAFGAAADRLELSIAALAVMRAAITGTLPLAAAEDMMDDIEDHMDIVGVKLKRALDIILAVEWV
jgi:hypothetical protein